MNDLTTLMRTAVAQPPAHPDDIGAVLDQGRRRVRRRRALAGGSAVLATGLVVAGLTIGAPGKETLGPSSAQIPTPIGPRIELSTATPATAGQQYDVLALQRNEDLENDNGTYLRGITDDGFTLLQDGPRLEDNTVKWGLRSPAGDVDWLPAHLDTDGDVQPLTLTEDALTFLVSRIVRESEPEDAVLEVAPTIETFDRSSRTWTSRSLPGLGPETYAKELGPDGRLWFTEPLTSGEMPAGGWPTGPDGEADDAGGTGDTYRLMSLSLDASTSATQKPRVEVARMGDFGFGDDTLVWTDSTNGEPGRVHVRNQSTGKEHSFVPQTGERCNLLGFSVAGERIALSQYCGTYDAGRDDRVQVIDLDGNQIGTVQGHGVEGGLDGPRGRFLHLTQRSEGAEGIYLVDLGSRDNAVHRLTEGNSRYALGSVMVPAGSMIFSRPLNGGDGDETSVIRWR